MFVWKALRSQRHLLKSYPRFRFSQQQKENTQKNSKEDPKQTPPSEEEQAINKIANFITAVFGGGLVTFVGYKIYQSQFKNTGGSSFFSKNNSTNEEEIVTPSHILKTIDSYGKNSIEAATAFTEEAKKRYWSGRHTSSIYFQEKALEIYKKLKGSESEEVATCYKDISSCFIGMAKLPEAREAMKKSTDIYLNLKQYQKAYDAMETIALTYVSEFETAKEQFEKIIALRKENIGASDPLLAKTYIRFAMLYGTQKMKEDVLDCLKKAFDLMKVNKPPKEELAGIHKELSYVYTNIAAFNEAIVAAQKAIEFSDPKTEAYKVAQLTKQIASTYTLLRNPQKSIEIYKTYVDQMKPMQGFELELGDTYRKIAEEYERMENYREAIDYWNKFIDVFRKENKTELAISGKMKACSLFLQAKQRSKALDCFEDVFMWASRDLGQEHKLTGDVFEILRAYKEEGLSQ